MTLQRLGKIILTVFLVSFQSIIYPQEIESISVVGQNVFSESDYINWSGLNPGDKFSIDETDVVEKNIALNLSDKGYFHSSSIIHTSKGKQDSQNISLTINITEGKPTYINQIYFTNLDSTDKENLSSPFQYFSDKILIKSDLENSIFETLDHFENVGFPFASVRINSVYFFDDSSDRIHYADVYLSFIKRETSTIDEIKIAGTTKTKDYVILRNIRIEEGDPYSQDDLEEIPKLLNRLSYFQPVDMPIYYFNSQNKGILEIKAEDRETNSFDGIIGYIPPSKYNESGFLNGFVKIGLRNIFGTERSALFKWQKEGRDIQELEINYTEPWIFGFPVNVSASLFQRQQDTTYVQRKFSGIFEFLATEKLSASILLSTESTIPSNNESGEFTVFNSRAIQTGINLKIDSRDNVYAPTDGLFFLNTYKYSSKSINGPPEYLTEQAITEDNLQRFEVDFIYFAELFSRQVISFGLHGRELRGNLIEESDLYRFGGTNTLRGYRENQFLGNRLLWSNFEYRYLLSKQSFAFLFFDTGYYLRDEDEQRNIERITDFEYGYGLGITFETGLGIMGISFALGKGDSFNEGKIHFGIINNF